MALFDEAYGEPEHDKFEAAEKKSMIIAALEEHRHPPTRRQSSSCKRSGLRRTLEQQSQKKYGRSECFIVQA